MNRLIYSLSLIGSVFLLAVTISSTVSVIDCLENYNTIKCGMSCAFYGVCYDCAEDMKALLAILIASLVILIIILAEGIQSLCRYEK